MLLPVLRIMVGDNSEGSLLSGRLFSHIFFDKLHVHSGARRKPHKMPPHVDVVVVFRAASKRTLLSKEQIRKDAARTERQYTALINTLSRAGLKAVGRRGENQDQLLVLVACPHDLLVRLVHRERSVQVLVPG